MFITVTLKDHPELMRLVRAAFPDYRKHHAFVNFCERVSISGTYWDGGSHSVYRAVDINTLHVGAAPQFNPPQFGGPKTDPVVEIPPGVAVIKGGTFCGKKATVSINLNPNHPLNNQLKA